MRSMLSALLILTGVAAGVLIAWTCGSAEGNAHAAEPAAAQRVVTADTDAAQLVSGYVSAWESTKQFTNEPSEPTYGYAPLTTGPFVLTDSSGGWLYIIAGDACTPPTNAIRGWPFAWGARWIYGSDAPISGGRHAVAQGEVLCTYVWATATLYSPALAWSGFRPYAPAP
jgi:hypothetical protein